jgi:hypothetical protein
VRSSCGSRAAAGHAFEPTLVPKYQRRLDGLAGNVISLYAVLVIDSMSRSVITIVPRWSRAERTHTTAPALRIVRFFACSDRQAPHN